MNRQRIYGSTSPVVDYRHALEAAAISCLKTRFYDRQVELLIKFSGSRVRKSCLISVVDSSTVLNLKKLLIIAHFIEVKFWVQQHESSRWAWCLQWLAGGGGRAEGEESPLHKYIHTVHSAVPIIYFRTWPPEQDTYSWDRISGRWQPGQDSRDRRAGTGNTYGTGKQGEDSKAKKAGSGHKGQNTGQDSRTGQDWTGQRTARIGKQKHGSQDRTAGRGPPGQDSRDETAGTRQPGQDSRNRTAGTGKSGQGKLVNDRLDRTAARTGFQITGQQGQYSRDNTAGTGLQRSTAGQDSRKDRSAGSTIDFV